MEYGPRFRTVERLLGSALTNSSQSSESLVKAGPNWALTTLHPGLLDGALQVAALECLPTTKVQTEPRLPFSVERVEVLGPLAEKMWVHVLGRARPAPRSCSLTTRAMFA